MDTELFILITDIIGTVAFAVSGAMAGIRKKMDIFGVNILALLTATGGGIIRDLVTGSTPPMAFKNPFFVIIAAIAANITFIFVWWQHKNKKNVSEKTRAIYDKIFFWFDTAGDPVPDLLPLLLTITGPDHVLFGSDYPFTPRSQALVNTQRLQEFLASDRRLAKHADDILDNNARKLLTAAGALR